MAPNVSESVAAVDLLHSALDTLQSNVAILDADGRILVTNDSWRDFGEANGIQSAASTVGMNYLDVTEAASSPDAERAAAGLRALLCGEREEFELEYPCHSPDRNRWFLLRAAAFTLDGERYATVAHVDITERRERERALGTAYRICASDRPFPEQVEELLELGRDVLGTTFGTLSHVEGAEYTFEAVAVPDQADLTAGETVSLSVLPNCARVVETEETLVVRDVAADAPELLDDEWGITAYLGAPVVVDGEVRGTFCFYSMEARDEAFSDWEVTFVELLSNWVSNVLERRHYGDVLTALDAAFPDLAFLIDAEGLYIDYLANGEMATHVPGDVDDLRGRTLYEVFPSATADVLLEGVREAIDTGRRQTVEYNVDGGDGTRWFEARVVPFTHGAHGPDAGVVVAREVTERIERRRELEAQRDQLAQLARLNTLVRELIQALEDTASRREIESAVCERLTGSALYQSAWVAVRELTEGRDQTVVNRTSAGLDDPQLDDTSWESKAARTAIDTGTVQVVDDAGVRTAQASEPRTSAPGRSHSRLVAVPLTTGATTYGVLVVAPPDDQSISEGETTVLADLGRMIAQAIQRVHSQRALNAETVVTLDLRSPETDLPFGEVTSALDCALTLDHRVATADGGVIYYFGVHDADPERVCQSLRETALDGECLVVRCGDDGAPARLEVRLDERPSLPTGVLNNYGGTVTRARFADGDLFLTAELPPTVEVRTVVDALREQAPGAELVSKRTVDRPIETASVRQDQVIEKLTPKQRAALEAAYARGYYAWPRETTVEELAESFDISASTLHYRLRKAHGTVLRAVIEGRQAE